MPQFPFRRFKEKETRTARVRVSGATQPVQLQEDYRQLRVQVLRYGRRLPRPEVLGRIPRKS